MPMLKLTDEQADQLIEWHNRVLESHGCVGDNEGLACCIDKLLIPNFVDRGWSMEQIADKTELSLGYVNDFIRELKEDGK
jgi:hypothetical protein